MTQTLKYLILSLVALLLLGIGFVMLELFTWHDSTERIVRIASGDNARTIGKKLEAAEIVNSAESFRILAKIMKADRYLKPGTYIFGGKTNLWQTVGRLSDGKSESIRITFPEGLSLHKTLLRIDASGLASYDELMAAATDTSVVRRFTGMQQNSMEGFLYPETYQFPISCTPDSILSMMSAEFFKRIQSNGLSWDTPEDMYKNLILASIVEKEAGSDSERGVIAGVFVNRIRIGMALQSCPTVDYILEKKGIKREVLTNTDTAISSPYNTYRNNGLPPTPICNPSILSILAAKTPAQHNFLYFFSDRKGKNVFSRSYEEHQKLQRQMRV